MKARVLPAIAALLVLAACSAPDSPTSPAPSDPSYSQNPNDEIQNDPKVHVHLARGQARPGSGGVQLLQYHGGAIMTSTVVQAIYWGPSWGNSSFRGDKITGLTSFGQSIFSGPLTIVLFLATLGIVFFMSFRIDKLAPSTALMLFMGYAALLGLMLSSVFLAYTGASITRTFFISAASFGSLSLYGYTTHRDLSPIGSFLIMGMFGLILAMVVNIFLKSSGLDFAISAIGVLIFAGLTAFDTQRIKEMYSVQDDGTVEGRKAVMGALALYLDFINLFLFLLRFMGDRR